MQAYKRKITYFYQFHNGQAGATAGFLKLEIRGERVKIIINIQEPIGLPYRGADLYFYHEAGDHLAAVKVDRVESIDGVLTYHTRKDWQQFYDTGRDLYTFDGALVVYNKTHYYIGDFRDKDRNGIPIKFSVPEEKKPEIASAEKKEEQKPEIEPAEKKEKQKPIDEKEELEAVALKDKTFPFPDKDEELFQCENCPYQEKRKELGNSEADAFEKMLEEYPKLSAYGATELLQCVRIHPKDIGKLDMKNWRLGVNSFLTHGYYTYQYLLLGKLIFGDGKAHPIIGVPGVYSNREKYLANMFGFELFIPVQKTGVKTGEFGYWVVEISV